MDEPARELVRDWLVRASRDLRSAHLLTAADDPPLDIAIYHCQRAAEKSIKAWLHGQECPSSQRPTTFSHWLSAPESRTAISRN